MTQLNSMSDVLKHMNDQIKPEPPIYVERKYCPDCKCYVQAQMTLYNPDVPEEGMIWECLQCGNAIIFGGIIMESLEERIIELEAQVKKLNELILMQVEINTHVAEILKD